MSFDFNTSQANKDALARIVATLKATPREKRGYSIHNLSPGDLISDLEELIAAELDRAREPPSDLTASAQAAGARRHWVTSEGYTQLPPEMCKKLGLGTDGGHVWFLPDEQGPAWKAWKEEDLGAVFGERSLDPQADVLADLTERAGLPREMAPSVERTFRECPECSAKPGSPVLCADCLARRADFIAHGECRPPRVART